MTIKQMQHLLSYLGYDAGPCDGLDGPRTRAACAAFQADYGVGQEGLVDAVAGKISKAEGKTFWEEIRYVPRIEWCCPCNRCGGFPTEPQEGIVRFLEELRLHFGKPVLISSGVRCQAHNDELAGSVWNSRHVQGKAVDFCVRGVSSTAVKVYCDRKVSEGVLRYCYCIDGSFLHADIL